MKWKPVSSRYRYCISRLSRVATSTGSSARKVLSRGRPVRTFLSLVRTNAPPLPGFTCWNSTTFMRLPSRLSVMPFLRSLVVAMGVTLPGAGQALVDHLGQDRQRPPAGAQHQVVEDAQVEPAAQAGLGQLPEPDQLQAADHVGQGLAGHGHVTVDLVLDVGGGEGGGELASRVWIAWSRPQPSWGRPVSTTSRQARHESNESMPKRSRSPEYRPTSSASRSVYRAQPSLKAVTEPKRRNRGSSSSSWARANWRWWPGTLSWKARASYSYRVRVWGAEVLSQWTAGWLPSAAAGWVEASPAVSASR